ncbi:Legume-like lectin family protein [Tritrichomonas foetus]|uniref:Legume-like lectin family protein n=1 Tax=Tritrichomonas foetus TaxID=1144522 RepID=A0A1J4K7M2_9EUKA|nr:Legume-like lectin family protein [Tritrichomonas foetus]|eukprot:OHT07002.1 Legume-like lectin family protein [Tritrichomonas foetus]
MFFLFLSLFVVSEPTSDLTPPFYPNEKNRIGYWDVGGAAIVYDTHIILSPPVQYRKGSIWSTLPIPYGEWSIDFEFNITEGNGGGFAIWLINKHGDDGNFFGGPQSFQGLVFTGSVLEDGEDGNKIKFDLFQSKGSDTFDMEKTRQEQSKSSSTIKTENKPIDLRMHITQNNISLQIRNRNYQNGLENDNFFNRINKNYQNKQNNGNHENIEFINLIQANLTVDLSKAWLGLTAMSDDFTSRVDFYSAKFNVIEYMQKRFQDSKKQQHLSTQNKKVIPTRRVILRNPEFVRMKKEIVYRNEKNGNILSLSDSDQNAKKVDDVLEVCDEFGEVLSQVATYGQLSEFVRKTIVPYTQNWHKRTFKIIESVSTAKSMLTEAFNQTKALIYVFNTTVSEMTTKTDRKIGNLNDLLNTEVFEQDKQDRERLQDVIKPSIFLRVLKYVSIAEISVFAAACLLHLARGEFSV